MQYGNQFNIECSVYHFTGRQTRISLENSIKLISKCLKMEGEAKTYDGEMPPVIVTHIRDISELLQYIENCKADHKVAPAYVFYLCALYCSEKMKHKLQLFLERAAIVIHDKGINTQSISAAVFYFANATELLHFLKNDIRLSEYSETTQNILITAIRCIVRRLLSFFMKGLNRGINDSNCFEKIIGSINATTTRLEQSYVNVGFINQLLSFLLQWICGKLIANNENASYYTELFKELEVYATTMDDPFLLDKVNEFYCLVNDGRKNAENTNVVRHVKLKWQPPNFLKEYHKGKYNSFIEKSAKLLRRCNGKTIQPEDESTTLWLLIPHTGYSWQNEGGMDCLNSMFSAIHKSGLCRLSNKHKNSGKWDVRLKRQKVETFCLQNIQFQVQQGGKKLEEELHVTGCSSDTSSLRVGDHILAVNGNTLIGITEEEAQVVTTIPSADGVQLDVVKIDACEVLIQSPTDVVRSGAATSQEIEIKFNLVESSSRNYNLNISQSVHGEHAQFFLDLINEVEGLDSMQEEFCGISEDDDRYIYMKEIMMRNILRLDTMDMKNNQEVKKTKRDVIYFIQDRIARLKAKLSSNQEKAKNTSDVNLGRNETYREDSAQVFTTEANSVAAPTEEMETCSIQSIKATENASCNRQTPTQHQLICETKYSLDVAETKFVSTGIYPISEGIVSVIKFSSGSSYLLLGIEDWIALLSYEELLREHLQSRVGTPLQRNFGRYNLRFQSNCVEITHENAFFNLDQECLHNLLQLIQLISCRTNLIQDYCYQFQQAIGTIAQPPADPILELLQQTNANPALSQLLNEYIHFYPDIIRKNVEIIQKRLGTTPKRATYV